MNKDDLKKLGIEDDELIQKIIVLHGKDIEKHKTAAETAKTEIDGVKAQLTEANKQIEAFKGMDIEGVKKSADEWKQKAEKAEVDAAAQLSQLRFDHALDGLLVTAKAKNPKAARALLDVDQLRKAFNETDGTIAGWDDHLKKVKESNDYLFEGEKPDPKIVAKSNNKTVLNDPFMASVLKGAGMPLSGDEK